MNNLWLVPGGGLIIVGLAVFLVGYYRVCAGVWREHGAAWGILTVLFFPIISWFLSYGVSEQFHRHWVFADPWRLVWMGSTSMFVGGILVGFTK